MKQITKEILKISIFFFIIITAFSAFQTIITKIHQQQSNRYLGPFRLSVAYSFYFISNIFIPSIQKSLKWLMCLGVIGHTINYSTGIYIKYLTQQVKFFVIGFGSIGSGIGDGLLYTTLGKYIHNLCIQYGQTKNKGKYYGIVSIFGSSGILASSIFIFFFLSLFSDTIFFISLTIIGLLSFLYGVFIIKNKEEGQLSQQKPYSIKQSLYNILNYYPKMFSILSFAVIDGINIAFSSSNFLHLITRYNNVQMGICIFIGSTGTLIGAFFGAKVCDYFCLKKTGSISLLGYFCAYVLCIISSLGQNYIVTCLTFFIWGIQYTFCESYLLVCCSRMYNGSKQSYAIIKQIYCLSFIIYQIFCLMTENKIQVYEISFLLLLFLIPSIISLIKFPKQRQFQSILLYNNQN